MNPRAKADHRKKPPSAYGTLTAADTVRIERLLPGPVERVWSYLTESEKRGRWLASGHMELEVGGRVEHLFNNSELTDNDEPPPAKYAEYAGEARMEGRITACEPPTLLSYTWTETGGEASEVCFELMPRNDRVLLVVTHRRLASREDLLGVSAGWHTHLDILADRLNNRTPPGFWATFARLETDYDKLIPRNED